MRKKLILFDWGNIVEAHTTGYTCRAAWLDTFRACGYVGDKDIFDRLSKYRVSCIRDSLEFMNVYELLKKDFGFNKNFQEFVEIYLNIFDKIDYYEDVSNYEKSLRDKCYIGIFSNLTIFDKSRLDKQVNLSNYDYVFLSFEYGLRKPERELYEIVQNKVPFEAKDILFIDDRSDNIETAKEMGWNAFQSTGLELDKIKEKCEEFLGN